MFSINSPQNNVNSTSVSLPCFYANVDELHVFTAISAWFTVIPRSLKRDDRSTLQAAESFSGT